MTEIKTDWSKAEFKAYFLLYAAHADQIETPQERDFILAKVDSKIYDRIHQEFDQDNDYQSIQKLLYTAEKYNYSKDDLESLMEDIKRLFLTDGEFTSYEQNLLVTLKMLFR
ncbi:MAG: hypothetical protein R2730_11155 [Chitinophagales bacterium]